MTPLLVAYDFSPCARTASRLAAALARKQGTSLVLLYVVPPAPIDLTTLPIGTTSWEQDLQGEASAKLEAEAQDLRQRGVSVETRVAFGSAFHSILDVARDVVPSLIVMGTHSRRGAAHLLVGSVAESVVRGSACPVLVTCAVPDLSRWEGGEPLRLAIAADGSRASQAAFYWTRTSAPAFGQGSSLIRLYWPPHEAARYGAEDAWRGNEGHPDLIHLLERDLRHDARALLGAHEPVVRFRVADHDAAEGLAEDVRQLRGDALVLGVSGSRRGEWSPVSWRAILRSSSVPVFCVPAAVQPAQRHIVPVRSVLLACDLSESSKAAILPAYGLLAAGGRVEMCYVHVMGPPDPLSDVPPVPRLSDVERADVEAQLRALVPSEAPEQGIITHVSVVEGHTAAETILAAAERLDTDAVAIGSHGRSGVARALLGSVAEQVTRHSRRPVVVVRSHPGAV